MPYGDIEYINKEINHRMAKQKKNMGKPTTNYNYDNAIPYKQIELA